MTQGTERKLCESISRFLSVDPAPFVASFDDDRDVYISYLVRVFGGPASELILSRDRNAEIMVTFDIAQGIRFPHDSGLDPRDPETAAWARFAIDRDIEFHPDAFAKMGRFTDPGAQVRQLVEAGVTLRYAEALDMKTWGQKYDVGYAVEMMQTGLPLEYAVALDAEREH